MIKDRCHIFNNHLMFLKKYDKFLTSTPNTMHTPAPLVSSELSFASFELVSFGQISIPPHPLSFGFQVDIVPSQIPSSQILFGLVSRIRDAEGKSRSHGFAVRLDLETGEIWDMINDTGLVAWVESPGTFYRFTDEEPMLLSWKVEHLGNALIPRLQIAGEEWLYPAVKSHAPMMMDTLAGCTGPKGSALTSFLHPAVWRESL